MTTWPTAKLGTVLRPIARAERVDAAREYRMLGARWYAQGLFVKERVLGQSISAQRVYRVESGDFVYNRLFAWKGSFALASDEVDGCYVSNEFPCFEIAKDRLEPAFLRWWFSQEVAWFRALGLSTGATPTSRNRLKEEDLLSLEIPLPPLPEQRRVVARLEEVAGLVEEASELHASAGAKAKALMHSRVSEVFTTGAGRGWRKATLGEFVVDCRYGTSKKTSTDRIGVPILGMSNIQNGRVDSRNLKYLHLSASERDRLLLRAGDILVNRTNSAELVGKCAVFRLIGDFSFASYLIRVRVDETRANPDLLARYINSPLGRAYMLSEKKQMTGQANVNSKKLMALPVCLPGVDEQHRLAADLDTLEIEVRRLEGLQTETSASLEALLPAVLDRAFCGEL